MCSYSDHLILFSLDTSNDTADTDLIQIWRRFGSLLAMIRRAGFGWPECWPKCEPADQPTIEPTMTTGDGPGLACHHPVANGPLTALIALDHSAR